MTRSPLAQAACVVQNPFPSVLWYAPSGQVAHAGALLVLEKLPTAQSSHLRVAELMNVPGVHAPQ
jgi:hypothetical protein